MIVPLIALLLQAEPAPTIPPEKVTAVVEAASKALANGRRVECHLTSNTFNSWAKDGRLNPAKETPFTTQNFSFRAFGPGRTTLLDPKNAYAHVEANGFHYGVATGEKDASVDRMSHDGGEHGLWLALQLDQFSPMASNRPIAETLRKSTPLSLTENGSTITYRFMTEWDVKSANTAREKDPNFKGWEHAITVDVSDPPRVMGWSFLFPGGKRTDRWTVDSWQTLDGKPIPRQIRREVTISPREHVAPGGKAPQGDLQTQIVEITDLAPIAADIATPPPVAEGTRVSDRKLEFEFTVGSTDIMLKGRALRLKEKLWEHPGDKLDELVKDAVER